MGTVDRQGQADLARPWSPLTDYLRYELAAYPGNSRAGETIGIIDLSELRPACRILRMGA
ncbi:DUF6879 family protein [Streptomyces sp. NPDC089922]|uniref:DUF6879 family protein n=1 Tax=Streptomyces sp. NPDC089922 TaxID=3155189 RepID=UPI00342C9BCF